MTRPPRRPSSPLRAGYASPAPYPPGAPLDRLDLPRRPAQAEDGRPSVMPRRWFAANHSNVPIMSYLDRKPDRPLVLGERQLGAFILPPFQRPPVWGEDQQILFIESMWAGLPLGAFCYNNTIERVGGYRNQCDKWLLDGQQRWTAIYAYVAGAFPVHDYRYPDLPLVDRRMFDMIPMPMMETRLTSPDACLEVYLRLAYGGTPHT